MGVESILTLSPAAAPQGTSLTEGFVPQRMLKFMVVGMEVDKVADMVADMEVDNMATN